jgi:hypothetical protein
MIKQGNHIKLRGYMYTHMWYIEKVERYKDRYGKNSTRVILKPTVNGEVQDIPVSLDIRTIQLLHRYTPNQKNDSEFPMCCS